MSLLQILICIFVLINLTAFVVMFTDKRRSTRGDSTERIPEGILFFIAAAFGSVGVYIGMFLLHHKTRKWYFQIGIPLLIAQQLVLFYIAYTLLLSPIH